MNFYPALAEGPRGFNLARKKVILKYHNILELGSGYPEPSSKMC